MTIRGPSFGFRAIDEQLVFILFWLRPSKIHDGLEIGSGLL